MKKIAKIFTIFLFISICQNSFAFEFKNPFKKKEPEVIPRMVETKQEWEIESQNIPLSEREIKKEKEEIDEKKQYVPAPKYRFEKYNFPQGTREANIEDIKKRLGMYPYLVTDKECRYAAYPFYYFSPHINQISSAFYVEKLDISKTKIERILDYFRNEIKFEIGNMKALVKEDYKLQKRYEGELISEITLPKSNVIKYFLEDGSWFVLRPSGTEPKMKVYISAVTNDLLKSQEEIDRFHKKYIEVLEQILEDQNIVLDNLK